MVLWTPFKKVGAPATFKGVKGPYLIKLLVAILIFFVILGVATVMSPSIFITLFIFLAVIIFLLVFFNSLKKKSKGDLNSESKEKCKIVVSIKSSPIKYDFSRKN